MIDVATIQTNLNSFEKRAFYAPRKGNSVNLDACPRGTIDVHSFTSIKEAASFMRVSESTVRRQLRAASDANEAASFGYVEYD